MIRPGLEPPRDSMSAVPLEHRQADVAAVANQVDELRPRPQLVQQRNVLDIAGRLVSHQAGVPMTPVQIKHTRHEPGIGPRRVVASQLPQLVVRDPEIRELVVLQEARHQVGRHLTLGGDADLLSEKAGQPVCLGRDGDERMSIDHALQERRPKLM